LTVGVELNKKRGDKVKAGDVLATIHANDEEKLAQAKKRLLDAYTIVEESIKKEPLIKDVIV